MSWIPVNPHEPYGIRIPTNKNIYSIFSRLYESISECRFVWDTLNNTWKAAGTQGAFPGLLWINMISLSILDIEI